MQKNEKYRKKRGKIMNTRISDFVELDGTLALGSEIQHASVYVILNTSELANINNK